MPYNPEPTNTTTWKFTCSCTYGEMVDTPSNEDGMWDPTTLCMERNAKGVYTQIVWFSLALFALAAFVFACDTMVRLRRRSRKSCCKTKLTGEIIGIILQTSTFFMMMAFNCATQMMMNNGVDHFWLLPIQQPFFFVQPLFTTLNTIVIAITWQRVGEIASYYQPYTLSSPAR